MVNERNVMALDAFQEAVNIIILVVAIIVQQRARQTGLKAQLPPLATQSQCSVRTLAP